MFGNVCEIEIIACDGLFAMWLSHSSKIELAIGIEKLRASTYRHTTLQVREQHKMTEEWASQEGVEVRTNTTQLYGDYSKPI